MIAGTRKNATSTPLTMPRTSPSPMPAAIATGAPIVCVASRSATANATSPIIASIDRSPCRVRTTRASPTAATAMIDAWAVTWVRFDADSSCGAWVKTKAPSTTMTATRLSSRWRAIARRARPGADARKARPAGPVAPPTDRLRSAALGRAGRREHHPLLAGLVAGDFRRDRPLVHDEDPIRHCEDLREVARDQDDPE